jgi:hypothetical protein
MPALTQAHGPCNLRLLARRDVIETVRQCHLRNFFQRIDAESEIFDDTHIQ